VITKYPLPNWSKNQISSHCPNDCILLYNSVEVNTNNQNHFPSAHTRLSHCLSIHMRPKPLPISHTRPRPVPKWSQSYCQNKHKSWKTSAHVNTNRQNHCPRPQRKPKPQINKRSSDQCQKEQNIDTEDPDHCLTEPHITKTTACIPTRAQRPHYLDQHTRPRILHNWTQTANKPVPKSWQTTTRVHTGCLNHSLDRHTRPRPVPNWTKNSIILPTWTQLFVNECRYQ